MNAATSANQSITARGGVAKNLGTSRPHTLSLTEAVAALGHPEGPGHERLPVRLRGVGNT